MTDAGLKQKLIKTVSQHYCCTADDGFPCEGACYCSELADAILALLPQPTGEPAAWRWRHTAEVYGEGRTPGPWNEGHPPPHTPGEAWRYEVQPLYATSPDVETLTAENEQLRLAICGGEDALGYATRPTQEEPRPAPQSPP